MSSDDGMSDIFDAYEFTTPDDYREIDLSPCTPLVSAPRPPPVPMPDAQIAHHRLQHLFGSLPPHILPVGPDNVADSNLLPPFPATNMPEARMLVDSAVAETGAEKGVQEGSNTLYPDPTIFQVSNTHFPESMDQNYSMPDFGHLFNPPETMMPGNELSDLGHSTNSAPETMIQENNFSSLGIKIQPLENSLSDQNLEFGLDPNLSDLSMYQQAEELPLPQSFLENVYIPEFDEFAANMVQQQSATSGSDPVPTSALPVLQTPEQEQLAPTDDSLGDELTAFLAEQDLLDKLYRDRGDTKEDEQPRDQAESTPQDSSADAADVSSQVTPPMESPSPCGSTYGRASRRGKKRVLITEPELNVLRAERYIYRIPGPPTDNMLYANLFPKEVEKIEAYRRENRLPETSLIPIRRKRFLVTEPELCILRAERYIHGRRRRADNAMWALLFPREIEKVEAYRRENSMPTLPDSTERTPVARPHFYLTETELQIIRGKKYRRSRSLRADESDIRGARLSHEEIEKLEAYRRENGTPTLPDSTERLPVVPRQKINLTDTELQMIRGNKYQPSRSLRADESDMRSARLSDEEIARLHEYRLEGYTVRSDPPLRFSSNGRLDVKVTDAEPLALRGSKYKRSKARNHTIGDLRLAHLTEEEVLELKALRDANGDEGVEGDAGPA
jgi:hypothetical protein